MILSSRAQAAAGRACSISLLMLMAMYAAFELTATPATVVGVRWNAQVTADGRRNVEDAHLLWNGRQGGPVNSTYDLLDTSRSNIRSLVEDRRVADTQGVNRDTFEPNPADTSDDIVTSVLARIPWLGHPNHRAWFVVVLLLAALPGAVAAMARRLGWESRYDTTPRLTAACVVAVVALLVALVRFATFGDRLLGDDHFPLWAAAAAYHGAVPYKDFFDPGAPLYWWMSLLGQIVSGYRAIGEVGVATALIAFGYALSFVQTWKVSRNVWLAGLVLGVSLLLVLPTKAYAYPKLFVYPVVLAAAWGYIDRQTTTRLLAMGATVAMAFLFRHDHGMFVVAAPVAAVVMGTGLRQVRLVTQRLITLGLLALAVLSPWLIWVQSTEGLLVYFPARLQQSIGAGLLEDRPGLGLTRPFLDPGNAGPWLFTLFALLPVACLVLVSLDAWRRTPERFPRERAYMTVAGLLTLTAAIGLMREMGRFCDIATLGVVPLSWIVSRAIVAHPYRSVAARLATVAALAVLLITTSAAAVFAHVWTYVPGRYPGETVSIYRNSIRGQLRSFLASPPIDSYAPADSDDDRQLIRYFRECTAPGEAIWDMNQNFAWPYYAERQNVLHPEWASGFKRRPEDQAYAIAWITRHSVQIMFSINIDPMVSLDQYPLIKAFVQDRYRDAATPAFYQLFSDERRNAWILVDKARTPVRIHPTLGLPCFR